MSKPRAHSELRALKPYTPISPLQLRMAKEVFCFSAWDLFEVMKAFGVTASMMTLWRAAQTKGSRVELQAEMRRVYEALGLIFYENEGIAFHRSALPSDAEIERRKLPPAFVETIHKLRAAGEEPKQRTILVRRLDGDPVTKPRKRGRRLNLPKTDGKKANEQNIR